MAADKRVIFQGLASSTDKALRRAKKLEKSLLKLVAQTDPGSAAENFLKSVQQGLKMLKKEAKKVGRSLPLEAAKAPETKAPARKKSASKPGNATQKPQRSASRSRKKASAAPEQAGSSEAPKA